MSTMRKIRIPFATCHPLLRPHARYRLTFASPKLYPAPAMKIPCLLRPAALLALALPLLAPAALRAQPPRGGGARGPGGGGATTRSPEVGADFRVTFRLAAAGAQAVNLLSDFSADTLPMTKGDNGVWTFTTEALKPGYYSYWFSVDGTLTPDPANTHVRPASCVYKSMVDVPGPGTEWMDFRDVPHGTLHEHEYLNKENGTQRRVVIYTPPAYERSTASYPVLYLLHGRDDYERGWTQTGRAHLIMDNLLAEGKAVPAIIVMPFIHDTTGATGRQPSIRSLQSSLGITPAGRGAGGAPGAARGPVGQGGGAAPAGATGGSYLERDILGNIQPLVESTYRVQKDKAHRALFGYSMGGSSALSIGLSHPELYAYVGGFSFPFGVQNSPAFASAEKTNADYKLIWLSSGTADNQGWQSSQNFHNQLTTLGIKHEWTASEGYHHDYQIWRIYLRDVLPKLFRE